MHNFYVFAQDPLSLYNTPGTAVYTGMGATHKMGDDLD